MEITLEQVIEALREIEQSIAAAVEADPDNWNNLHTSRLAAARGRAAQLLRKYEHGR